MSRGRGEASASHKRVSRFGRGHDFFGRGYRTRRSRRETSRHAQPLTHNPDAALFPLSAAQRATWFAQQLEPAVPISIAQYVELHGDLDVDLLRRETVAAGREFQSPFLKVVEVDGRPMQYVDHTTDTSIAFLDFRGENDPVAAAHDWMDKDYRTPSISRPIDWSRRRSCVWASRITSGTAASTTSPSTDTPP